MQVKYRVSNKICAVYNSIVMQYWLRTYTVSMKWHRILKDTIVMKKLLNYIVKTVSKNISYAVILLRYF